MSYKLSVNDFKTFSQDIIIASSIAPKKKLILSIIPVYNLNKVINLKMSIYVRGSRNNVICVTDNLKLAIDKYNGIE